MWSSDSSLVRKWFLLDGEVFLSQNHMKLDLASVIDMLIWGGSKSYTDHCLPPTKIFVWHLEYPVGDFVLVPFTVAQAICINYQAHSRTKGGDMGYQKTQGKRISANLPKYYAAIFTRSSTVI